LRFLLAAETKSAVTIVGKNWRSACRAIMCVHRRNRRMIQRVTSRLTLKSITERGLCSIHREPFFDVIQGHLQTCHATLAAAVEATSGRDRAVRQRIRRDKRGYEALDTWIIHRFRSLPPPPVRALSTANRDSPTTVVELGVSANALPSIMSRRNFKFRHDSTWLSCERYRELQFDAAYPNSPAEVQG